MKYRGTLITAASGSLNGVVFSHNRGGPYTRARVTPTFPNTTEQQGINGALSYVSALWPFLSQAQRTAWSVYSKAHPRRTVLGDERPIGGRQEFCRTNVIRRYVRTFLGAPALTMILNPPTGDGDGTDAPAVASLNPALTQLKLDFTVAQNW